VASWTPIDDVLALVNEAFFIKGYKDFYDGLTITLIHRKSIAFPIAGGSDFFALVDNGSAVFFFPGP